MKVQILGAGPAGLTAAKLLADRRIQTEIFEAASEIGGLAKTVEKNGFRFDIGGHRFFSKSEWVQNLWHSILGDELIRVKRVSRIYFDGNFFQYPIRPLNAMKGLGLRKSLLTCLSYLRIKAFPLESEESFENYVINRFGRELYSTFFKSYTEKVWGIPCSEIKADWATQRIKGLSLKSTLMDALGVEKGKVKSLIEHFEYPRLGPGQLWEKICKQLRAKNCPVHLNSPVKRILHSNNRIQSIEIESGLGRLVREGTHFISSIPLGTMIQQLDPQPPRLIREAADALQYRDLITVNLIIKRKHLFPDNWIYVHSPTAQVARIQNFKNWSPAMVPDDGWSSLGLEYFCSRGDTIWSLAETDLVALAKLDLKRTGISDPKEIIDGFVIRVQKAYPTYSGNYRKNVDMIRGYLSQFQNLQMVGRNGLHKYNNLDHSMICARYAVENLFGAQLDIWEVNNDSEYQEEISLNSQIPASA